MKQRIRLLAVTGNVFLFLALGMAPGCTPPGGTATDDSAGQLISDSLGKIRLGAETSVFELTPGEVSGRRALVTFEVNEGDITSGGLAIDPGDVSFVRAPSLGSVAGAPVTVEVVAILGRSDQAATVCEEGVRYGTFTVVFDGDLVPGSVSPDQINMTDETIQALNDQEFTLCFAVRSATAGTFTLEAMTLVLDE